MSKKYITKGEGLPNWSNPISHAVAALIQAGFAKSDVVFVDIAFDNLDDLPIINALYMELFPKHKRPARTIYQAAALPFGGKIKVTGTAVKDL